MNNPSLALKSVQKQERKDMTKYDGNKGNKNDDNDITYVL